METLITFGRTLGFSFAAGLNLYATVAILGLASRYGWVELPPQFEVFDHDLIIGAALFLYVVEFLADKIPWFDSLWDALHTFIRPIGGALVAVTTLGEASPTLQGLVALLGGTVAAGSHLTKAGSRVMVNTSPEPFSNWIVSLLEDVAVVGLGFVALQYPLIALAVSIVLIGVVGVVLVALVRGLSRRAGRARHPGAAADPVARSPSIR